MFELWIVRVRRDLSDNRVFYGKIFREMWRGEGVFLGYIVSFFL